MTDFGVRRLGLRAALFVTVLGSGLLHAGEGFRIGIPEVLKVNWQTRSLVSEDIDGDGLVDLALINNDDARIELFYQLAPGEKAGETRRTVTEDRWEPVLDDARFERAKVFTGGESNDLAFGDLNGDQRPDLIYTNDRDELIVHYQGESVNWSTKEIVEIDDLATWTGTIRVADLNADGKPELILVARNRILIFDHGAIAENPRRYPTVHPVATGLEVHDVNGDGRVDLTYLQFANDDEAHLVVRLQDAKGSFVGELFVEIEPPATSLVPFQNKPGFPLRLATISKADQTLQKLVLHASGGDCDDLTATGDPAETKLSFSSTVFAVPSQHSQPSHFAVADFNGDKRLDVAASDSPGAQIWIFFQDDAGRFQAPESYPALADISDLAAGDTDGDGTSELIVLSAKEGIVGISRYDRQRMRYPERLPLTQVPHTVAVQDVDGDGKAEIACAVEGTSSRNYSLVMLRLQDDQTWSISEVDPEKREIGSRVQQLRFGDVNQDGRPDLLALSSVQSMEVFLQNEDGSFASSGENGTRGFKEKIAPVSVSEGDIDGDGKPELLFTRDSFTRCARIDSNGDPEVVDQINAPEPESGLVVSVSMDVEHDGEYELLLIDDSVGKIHVMRRDEDGVYRLDQSCQGVRDDVMKTVVADANGDGKQELFLFSEQHFYWFPMTPARWLITEEQLYETDLKDMSYQTLLSGDLNRDGKDDLVVFDNTRSHIMEVLLNAGDEANPSLQSALHFKLFEQDPSFRGQAGGRHQPHEGILADLNNDERLDIVILLHDRLLIYPQQ